MSSSYVKKRRRGTITDTASNDDNVSPVRNCNDLVVIAKTIKCAHLHGCIPCAYKVATFDVALDDEICRKIPNRRPELCPRLVQSKENVSSKNDGDEHPLGYTHGMSILTVGDGDFSFSLALARFGCDVVATSYESAETVRSVYTSVGVIDHIAELERLGALIYYDVDATKIERTLPRSVNNRTFQRIVWNFPCSAVAKGQDGQNIEMNNNIALIRAFVQSAERHCQVGGQIHINHKTKPPFNQWKIEEVAVANTDRVRFLYRVVLDRALFHPYIPRKALDRKSFPCHDACTYIFEVFGNSTKQSDSIVQEWHDVRLPILSDLNELRGTTSMQIIRVTPHLIGSLREGMLHRVVSNKIEGSSKAMKKKREL